MGQTAALYRQPHTQRADDRIRSWANALPASSPNGSLVLMSEHGHRPDALLMTRERYTSQRKPVAMSLTVARIFVQYATRCRPVPGDSIVVIWAAGEGLVAANAILCCQTVSCTKDSERFIAVDWVGEPTCMCLKRAVVTVNNGKGCWRVAGRACQL